MRTIELLAPAKNLECGIAAIDHGADAVYIGAAHYGARAAAGNSIDDIKALCEYAHRYGAGVHVTVNTIIYNNELADTLKLISQLQEAGADALLIQDMGLLASLKDMKHPALHASTQCDTRTADKVKWLKALGFSRVVLARELSAEEIADIHSQVPDIELEVFVHGALCVSYSGVCYASQHCFKRSANRGECAQFCRLKFDLKDADGKVIAHDKHLLSLKDMCQIEHLEELMDAGASAFKIEGRLKDADYVKNVVAAYSQKIDDIIRKRPDEYRRASLGRTTYSFTPNLQKTFNRGYTNYFLNGRRPDIFSPNTPKAMGEFVGHVKEVHPDYLTVAGTAAFANGDGLCLINSHQELEGFRVNKAIDNKLFPFKMPENLRHGMALYRNNDQAFEKILAGKTAVRKMRVNLSLQATSTGISLTMALAENMPKSVITTVGMELPHQIAQKPQHDNIIRQLSKLGNTAFEASEINISEQAEALFIPSSKLAELRRQVAEELQDAISSLLPNVRETQTTPAQLPKAQAWQAEYEQYPYLYNIANTAAVKFYEGAGLTHITPSFEEKPVSSPLIMQCRHCLRYSLGYCVRRGGKRPTWHEPLFLTLPDGRKFRLSFQCNECQMNIYAEK